MLNVAGLPDTRLSGDARDGERAGAAAPRSLGRMVVGSMLTTAALRFRDSEALVCAGTGRRFTFRQMNERSNRLAHALLGLGLRKPEVVAFLCNNRAEIAEIYFALAKSGLVGIPLNYRLAPAELVALARAMGARALLFADRFVAATAAVREALPSVETFVAIREESGRPDWALGYETMLAGSHAGAPEVEVEEHAPFYFNLTSGTTGVPKSYLLTHYNNAALWPNFEAFEPSRRDVVLTALPAFGRIGFAWIATAAACGARNVLMDFTPGDALRVVEAERVTLVNLAPTMAAMMLAEPGLRDRDLGSLRTVIFVGAPLPGSLRERVAVEICPWISEYYGMQETGVLTASTPEDRVRRPDSVGLPICYAEVRIERPDGTRAAPGELGEILGRSPNTVTAYFDNPAKTAETFRGGWVHTGDLGCVDEEGYLYIRGRLKDLIITGGQNVHAAEVEEAILWVPGVAECAVFGLPDDLWGERVAAVVVTATAVSAETVAAICRERLAGFKVPRTIVIQEEPLPRTPTGKVQKFLLAERQTGQSVG